MSAEPIIDTIQQVAAGKSLTREQAARAFQIVMNGGATPAQMAALLLGLAQKGEAVDEILGAVDAIHAKATAFALPAGIAAADLLDTCGTGGDAHGTYNISTAVALTLAACGVKVAKHGNRSVSSKSGSADVLEACGVDLAAEIPVLQRALAEFGFCFLMAPKFHAAMRHVAPVRQELKIRTIFNLIGPLVNPAAPGRQLLGVYDPRWLEPMAEVLRARGCTRAWVVCARDGLDELSLNAETDVVELKDGALTRFVVQPEDAGLPRTPLAEIKGGNAEHNAQALRDVLRGAKNAYRDAVLLNAAAALVIAEKAATLPDAAAIAADALDRAAPMQVLERYVTLTRSTTHA